MYRHIRRAISQGRISSDSFANVLCPTVRQYKATRPASKMTSCKISSVNAVAERDMIELDVADRRQSRIFFGRL
jgi:hypothetical protein